MKKWAFILGVFGASAVALAGSVSNQTVAVWTDSSGLTKANGDLEAARHSGDSTQYIGCSLYAYDSGSLSATCYAESATGQYASCSTDSPQMLQLVASLNSASYLYFGVNADGSCAWVVTVNSSFNLP
jgi:hypothetical protein